MRFSYHRKVKGWEFDKPVLTLGGPGVIALGSLYPIINGL